MTEPTLPAVVMPGTCTVCGARTWVGLNDGWVVTICERCDLAGAPGQQITGIPLDRTEHHVYRLRTAGGQPATMVWR